MHAFYTWWIPGWRNLLDALLAAGGTRQGRSHVSKTGVSIYPSCPYKRRTAAVKGVYGRDIWEEEGVPFQPTRESGESVVKLP